MASPPQPVYTTLILLRPLPKLMVVSEGSSKNFPLRSFNLRAHEEKSTTNTIGNKRNDPGIKKAYIDTNNCIVFFKHNSSVKRRFSTGVLLPWAKKRNNAPSLP